MPPFSVYLSNFWRLSCDYTGDSAGYKVLVFVRDFFSVKVELFSCSFRNDIVTEIEMYFIGKRNVSCA